ncbi:MAG: subclass B3 metallo-beta-lactamase [Bacillota bacterium]
MKIAALAFAAVVASDAMVMPLDRETAEWNRPVAPFAIAEGLYYVGAAEVSSFAIRTPAGIVLIDSGFHQSVPLVIESLKTLGFGARDVKWILESHAHYDHVGGIAELKRLTGATVIASAEDAALMARGGLGDFAFGDRFRFPPVSVDRIVADREALDFGGVKLTANITRGHTKGCTTWTMQARVDGVPKDVVFLCSVTTPGYRLVDNDKYPRIVADYRASFARLRSLPCDILLASHGSMFDLSGKRAKMRSGGNPFVDPAGCRRFIDASECAFENELARQQGRN